jgi:hypothetical protein
MRATLSRSFRDDIRATSELIGRDLGAWMQAP